MRLEQIREHAYRLLRRSEKYTKTDMVYVARSGFWLTVGQGVSSVSSLILSVLFANFVSKDVFGIYKYILSSSGLFGALSLTGIGTTITRAAAQGRDGVFRYSLRIQVIWATPQVVTLLSIALYYWLQGNVGHAMAFAVASICVPIVGIAKSFNFFLHGKEDFKTATRYGVAGALVSFVVLATVIIIPSDYLSLVVTYYVMAALTSVYFCLQTLKKYPPHDHTLHSEDYSYAKHLSVVNVAGTVAQQVDAVLIYHLLGPAQLAIYTFATIIPDRVRSVIGSIASFMLPRLASKQTVERANISRKFLQLLLISIPLTILLIICLPAVFNYLFPQYLESVFYAQIYALVLIATPTQITLASIYAVGNKRALYVLQIGLPVLKIVLSVTGIVLLNILGAILARVVYYLFFTFVSRSSALSMIKDPASKNVQG